MFKKFYKKYFHIDKNEKISDLTYSTRLTFSLAIIVLCLFALCSTTFAYFTASVTSSNNTIAAASASTLITKDGQAIIETYVTTTVQDDLHTFVINAEDSQTETCYVKITIKDGDETKEYFTTQLFKTETENKPSEMTLNIQAKKGVSISFETRWGTSSYYIQDTNVTLYDDDSTIVHSTTPYISYTLAANETLDDLITRLGYSNEAHTNYKAEVLAFNGLESVSEGNEIKLPYIDNVPAIVSEVETDEYIVQDGDNLEIIATAYGISVDELIALNEGLTADSSLTVGETIKVPLKETEDLVENNTICEHEYTVTEDAATCTTDGSTTKTCSKCDATETTVINALGHELTIENKTDATCTTKGYYTEKCTRCDHTANVEEDALGHTWGESVVTVKPTCTEAGKSTKTCTRCRAVEESEIPALGHNFVEISRTEASTEAAGSYTLECTRCGTKETIEIPQLETEQINEGQTE